MLRNGGSVTVMSAVQAPREFLEDLVTEEWRPFDDEAGGTPVPREDGEVSRYVDERGSRLVAPVVAALASRGLDASTVFVESEDAPTAIVKVAEDIGADTIVMGATRQLFAESAWASVSMRVTAESKLPVLLIPAPSRPVSETDDEYDFAQFPQSED